LSNKEYDGTVYQTQIIDWLNLYLENGVEFHLFQFLHIKEILRISQNQKQKQSICANYDYFKGYILQFPNTKIFYLLNAALLFFRLLPLILKANKIVLFGRVLIGNEVKMLKKVLGNKIEFIFDARAASAEESKYVAEKNGTFNISRLNLYNRIKALEFSTIQQSWKTFAVSNNLINYYISNYQFDISKFILYPCFSDQRKFYFNGDVREATRAIISVRPDQKLLLYAGGFNSEWHITDKMMNYFKSLISLSDDFKLLIITKDIDSAKLFVNNYNISSEAISIISVSNSQVNLYLNAADFGMLFRDITVMNIVASPSKFSEYQLAGLPVLITASVGDFSEYVSFHKTGIAVNLDELNYAAHINELLTSTFNRNDIAAIAKSNLTKQSIIGSIVAEFRKV